MSKKYRPSNGTEGDCFMSEFCYQCDKFENDDVYCKINMRTMAYSVDDDKYPVEWQCDEKGAWCTEFTIKEPWYTDLVNNDDIKTPDSNN